MPENKQIIFLYGGAFDPPHLGHERVARELSTHDWLAPLCSSVQIVPTAQSTLKTHTTSAEKRLKLARLAFQDIPKVGVNPVEIDRARLKPGYPSTTWETVHELKKLESEYGSEFCFVMGTDQLEKWPEWFRFPEVTGLCHWLVLERRGLDAGTAIKRAIGNGIIRGAASKAELALTPWARYPSERVFKLSQTHGKFLVTFPTQAPMVSSTEIRRKLALGDLESLRPVLNPEIFRELANKA